MYAVVRGDQRRDDFRIVVSFARCRVSTPRVHFDHLVMNVPLSFNAPKRPQAAPSGPKRRVAHIAFRGINNINQM